MTDAGLYARLGIHTRACKRAKYARGKLSRSGYRGQNQRQHGNSRDKFPKQPWCQKSLPAVLLTPSVPKKWTCLPAENSVKNGDKHPVSSTSTPNVNDREAATLCHEESRHQGPSLSPQPLL